MEHCDEHHLTGCFQDGSKAPALFYDCAQPYVPLSPATDSRQFHDFSLSPESHPFLCGEGLAGLCWFWLSRSVLLGGHAHRGQRTTCLPMWQYLPGEGHHHCVYFRPPTGPKAQATVTLGGAPVVSLYESFYKL